MKTTFELLFQYYVKGDTKIKRFSKVIDNFLPSKDLIIELKDFPPSIISDCYVNEDGYTAKLHVMRTPVSPEADMEWFVKNGWEEKK